MIVIVDGYNLLKHLFPKEKGKLDKHRDLIVSQLGFYKKKKEGKIKEIVLVFDGGHWSHATREIRHGITVIFSGQDQNADDWIVDYVERMKGEELLVVTRDKELISRCSTYAEAVSVVDFYDIVQNVLLDEVSEDLKKSSESGIKKYEQEDKVGVPEIHSEALDVLMKQISLEGYDKLEERVASRQKTETPSKKDKKRLSKIKKL
jgi:predicted RNA-binding protein with PIN domain